ncbi:MAG: hypothetical protein U0V56_11205 [Actinomycetota bacterium]
MESPGVRATAPVTVEDERYGGLTDLAVLEADALVATGNEDAVDAVDALARRGRRPP